MFRIREQTHIIGIRLKTYAGITKKQGQKVVHKNVS